MDLDKNVWGTDKADIDADEFCPDCEREVPGHYTNCPTREAPSCEHEWAYIEFVFGSWFECVKCEAKMYPSL